MDSRALLAAVLSVLVIILWQYLFPPPLPPEPPAADRVETPESNAGSEVAKAARAVSPTAAPARSGGIESSPASASVRTADSPDDSAPLRQVDLSNDKFDLRFTSLGATLESVKLREYSAYHTSPGPFEVIPALLSGHPISFKSSEPMDLLDSDAPNALPFSIPSVLDSEAPFRLIRQTRDSLVFERRGHGVRVEKAFHIEPDSYRIGLSVTIENLSGAPLVLAPELGIAGQLTEDHSSAAPIPVPIAYVDGKAHRYKAKDVEKDAIEPLSGPIRWFGVEDKYFLRSAIVDAIGGTGTFRVSKDAHGAFTTHYAAAALQLPAGGRTTLEFQLFMGPKQSEILKAAGHDLIASLDFGIFAVFAEALLWLLKKLYSLVGSYGLSIILVTFIIKTLFYPLMVKQLESANRMKELQPQMAALREKYKDDRNRLNQEMMKFMQENKINPLGGCLPILLQMPIWFALYHVLQNSIELYHTEFLYLQDLSARDPYGLSPLLLGILMFFQQKVLPASPGMDPAQAKMMQYMPLIFSAIMFTLPSGLVVYIMVNTTLTMLQQWFIKKRQKPALVKA